MKKDKLCKNKMCSMFSMKYRGHCNCWDMGLNQKFILWCPMRQAYLKLIRRLTTIKWVKGKGKDYWNNYQIKRRKRVNFQKDELLGCIIQQ